MTAKKEGATVGRNTVMTPEVVEKLYPKLKIKEFGGMYDRKRGIN